MPSLQPLALARPRSAHRFEAFSLKLARRVTLYRHVALQQWVLFEANPTVEAFCERPGFVIIDGQSHKRRPLLDARRRPRAPDPCLRQASVKHSPHFVHPRERWSVWPRQNEFILTLLGLS
jgi:hypothetical protein